MSLAYPHHHHSFHLATLPFELHTKEPTPEVSAVNQAFAAMPHS
jgi:hypothetical protein